MEMRGQLEDKKPLISVVIPVYNRRTFVVKAVESVLAQDYQNKEVVVVDDGSTDGTYEKLKELKDTISLYKQDNKGQYFARNLGWRACKGDYVIFLDSDDVLEPDAISILWAALSQAEKIDPTWGVSYGKTLTCDANLNEIKSKRKHNKYYSGDILLWFLFGGFLRPCGWLVRKSILEEIGGFKEDVRPNWDRVLLCLIASRYRFVFVDKLVGRYRRHKEGRASEDKKAKLKQGTKYLDYFFREAGELPDEILKAKNRIYARAHLKLLKIARRESLLGEYLYHWKKACFYYRLFFLHPKYLIRNIFSLYLTGKDR